MTSPRHWARYVVYIYNGSLGPDPVAYGDNRTAAEDCVKRFADAGYSAWINDEKPQ